MTIPLQNALLLFPPEANAVMYRMRSAPVKQEMRTPSPDDRGDLGCVSPRNAIH